jgi:hypothetical protein
VIDGVNDSLIIELAKNVGAPTVIAIVVVWMLGRRLDEVGSEVRALRQDVAQHLGTVTAVLVGRRRGDQPLTIQREAVPQHQAPGAPRG